MSNQNELAWRMLKDLDYLFDAIEKAEDKVETLREYTIDMAISLKEYMDENDMDYIDGLDRVLYHSKGKSYKSLVDIFGLTPGEIVRKSERNKPRILGPGDWVIS